MADGKAMKTWSVEGARDLPKPCCGKSGAITTPQQRAELVLDILEGIGAGDPNAVMDYQEAHRLLTAEFERLGMQPHGATRVASDTLGGGEKGHGAKAVRVHEGKRVLVVAIAREWALALGGTAETTEQEVRHDELK